MKDRKEMLEEFTSAIQNNLSRFSNRLTVTSSLDVKSEGFRFEVLAKGSSKAVSGVCVPFSFFDNYESAIRHVVESLLEGYVLHLESFFSRSRD